MIAVAVILLSLTCLVATDEPRRGHDE